MVGRLLGMKPAAVDCCRVLELGCGPATNLIAMAEGLRDSNFVGVDASSRHVDRAQHIIDALALRNVCVLRHDIRSFDPGPERFDYVIAHGVYSWVDDEVRRALLRIIRAALSDQGIAFVSYNTFPGWFPLLALREMMRFHGRDDVDPMKRAAKATEILAFLLDTLDPQTSAYAANLAAYKRATESRTAFVESERISSILHDELAGVNEPMFFHQFMAQADGFGLQYMAEADLHGSTPTGLAPSVVSALGQLAPDLISLEQYMDFLMNRTFRQTLLCGGDVRLTRSLKSSEQTVNEFYYSSSTEPPEDPAALMTIGALCITGGDGKAFATDHSLSKAALIVLAYSFPRSLTWPALISEAAHLVGEGAPGRTDCEIVAGNLLRAFTAGRSLVGLSTLSDRFVPAVSSHPKTGPLVRLLAAERRRRVPNRKHEPVLLPPMTAAIAKHLDGTRSLEQLRAIHERVPIEPATDAPAEGEETFESRLAFLARSALLDA